METKPTLLLHSCCAPCSSSVIERLKNDYDITVFYYNPNIYPKEEYAKRKNEQIRLLKQLEINLIEGKYEPEKYFDCIKGFENQKEGEPRCYECYKLRLNETFKKAKELNFDFFTTTLSVSPMKNARWINEIGIAIQNEKCKFLVEDFKKKDGYKRSIELSKEFDLYRQNYCGCEASLFIAQHKCLK